MKFLSFERTLQVSSLVVGVVGIGFGYTQFSENTRLQQEVAASQARLAEMSIQAQLASSSQEVRPRWRFDSVEIFFLEEAGGLKFTSFNFGNKAIVEICTSFSGNRLDNLDYIRKPDNYGCFETDIQPGEKFDTYVQLSTNLNSTIGALARATEFHNQEVTPHAYLDCDPGIFEFRFEYLSDDGRKYEDSREVIIGSKTTEPAYC